MTGKSPDRQLRDAAEAMRAAAQQGRPVVPVLKERCPHVYRQIVRDRRYPGLLSRWGRSVNVDENTGDIIVDPAIVEAVGELAGVPMGGPVVHAGLQHTYGYLFSLIETPYGAKRDRWLDGHLPRGLGIEPSLLSDRPRQGTLLANLTWLLTRIVFHDRPWALRRLAREALAAAPALVDYDYARLAACRVVERAALPGKPGREILLRTDLVPFPHPPADPEAESTLLIYSVQNGPRAPLRLVTAFPIRPQAAREIKASAGRRGRAEVHLRYNAYVPGLFGRTVPGRRIFAGPPCQN
jgi:hypothetical protein